MDLQINGKVAVVTGAGHGIGKAVALALANEGALVAAVDRDSAGLEQLAGEAADDGLSIRPYICDLGRAEETGGLFDRIVQDLGQVDILVNNVGQPARERATEFWCSEPEIWDFVIDISLKVTLRCAREVVPAMRQRKSGKIINIASDVVFAGDAGLADYVAAKAGVIGFTKALARELAPFQVNVNAVAPGPTQTRAAASPIFHQAAQGIPAGRVGKPEDIANAVAFLSGAASEYVTGQVIIVNGGRVFG